MLPLCHFKGNLPPNSLSFKHLSCNMRISIRPPPQQLPKNLDLGWIVRIGQLRLHEEFEAVLGRSENVIRKLSPQLFRGNKNTIGIKIRLRESLANQLKTLETYGLKNVQINISWLLGSQCCFGNYDIWEVNLNHLQQTIIVMSNDSDNDIS